MNIFAVNSDPRIAARQLCDKHVVKMPTESAQMLCTVLRGLDVKDVPYKSAHPKHPCTLWAGRTRSNFQWLLVHGEELCLEYTRRYNREHACEKIVRWCADYAVLLPEGELTEHPQAMPGDVKARDFVTAYRNYYVQHKARTARWKNTNPPDWWPYARQDAK